AAVAVVGCKQYDVKYQPFNPRGMQEGERTSAVGAPLRPTRALPTTLETEFPIDADTTQPGGATTQASTRAASNQPPTTGPALGSDEPVVRMSLRELVQRAAANSLD